MMVVQSTPIQIGDMRLRLDTAHERIPAWDCADRCSGGAFVEAAFAGATLDVRKPAGNTGCYEKQPLGGIIIEILH